MNIIRLSYECYDEMVRYAKSELPNEACGLLAGKQDADGKEVLKVYYLTNTDHATDHFTIDPKEQLAAIKDMRANGYVQLAFTSPVSVPSVGGRQETRIRSKGQLYDLITDG